MAVKARFICVCGDAERSRNRPVTEKAQRSARIGQIPVRGPQWLCKFWWNAIMSDSLITSANSIASHNGASDLRILAQVEKWMAMIREINREQQGALKFPAVG
jgi:hypothetical protein